MCPYTFSSLNFGFPPRNPRTRPPATDFRPPEFSAGGSSSAFPEFERPARLLQLCRGLRQVFRSLNFFRRPQFRAARPRIAIALFFSCRQRLLRQQTEVTLLRSIAEGIFHDAIFQRVKTDHHHASPWLQNPGRRVQQRPQIVQFAVYEDSERLKSSGRRMNSPLFRIHWPGRG